MEQKITEYAKEKYQPAAIILHGSRAVGHERAHSDWDLILLFHPHEDLPANGRWFWQEHNIEYSCHQLPITDIEKEFGIKLQFGRVLYEQAGVASELLQIARDYYAQPLKWSTEQTASHRLWVQGRVDGMRDTIAEPLLFEKYASDFYSRITNYWYWVIQNSFPKPIYVALDEIKEQDPAYYSLIETFVTEIDRVKRVAAAENITQRCFG